MAEPDPGLLTDAEILRSVEATVRQVLLPALRDDADWARAAAVQLVGLVRYALARDARTTVEGGTEEFVRALQQLRHNDVVAAVWDGSGDAASVAGAVGAALAAAVTRSDAAADEVRAVLRPIALRQLDDDLALTAPMVDAFRGRLDG